MTARVKRIESRENPTFKFLATLRQPRRSQKAGLVFLEGIRLCVDALQSGVVAEYLLFNDSSADLPAVRDLSDLTGEQTQLISLPDRLFKSLSDTQNPQGVALICHSPLIVTPPDHPAVNGLYLVAENIQDPGNLGTMIRTADAFAFDAVILTGDTTYPFSDKVLRSAMGSCFHIPLLELPDITAVVGWLSSSDQPASVLAADPNAPDGVPANLRFPAALVIGNEARGLSDEARQLCTDRVSIAMPGRADSLNAAAASAILSHELMLLRTQRKKSIGTVL